MQDVIVPALYALLVAVAPVFVGFATAAVRRWGKRQKAAWIQSVSYRVSDAVDSAVEAVEETFAKERRDANGKLTGRDAQIAFQRALSAAYVQLGEELMSDFVRIMGGEAQAAEAAGIMIETAVKRHKSVRSSEEFLGN